LGLTEKIMLKRLTQLIAILALFTSIVLISGCKQETNKNDFLKKVLSNLEQIKSARYSSTSGGIPPGKTVDTIRSNQYTEEYFNPSDPFIGSSFSTIYQHRESKYGVVYDGNAQIFMNWDPNTIRIDSFQNNQLPFRPMITPFFNYTKSIIKYALETTDSIITEIEDFGDSVKFSIYIPNKVVEFFGKGYVMDNPYLASEDAFSSYEIWIHKSDYLPFRYKRTVPNETYWLINKKTEFNIGNIEDFAASNYFPSDYSIVGQQIKLKKDMVGKAAPEWTLKDVNNKSISLRDLKSKILLIKFTGIGCGPCHASLPFTKQLVQDYSIKDFEIISIETWSSDIDIIKSYSDKNELNYKYLLSTEEIKKSYQVNEVPAFFLLDEKRMIRKVILGYGEGTTDKEIRDAINELI
jgi:thiol-disulfide isomerase/thioredoxin